MDEEEEEDGTAGVVIVFDMDAVADIPVAPPKLEGMLGRVMPLEGPTRDVEDMDDGFGAEV